MPKKTDQSNSYSYISAAYAVWEWEDGPLAQAYYLNGRTTRRYKDRQLYTYSRFFSGNGHLASIYARGKDNDNDSFIAALNGAYDELNVPNVDKEKMIETVSSLAVEEIGRSNLEMPEDAAPYYAGTLVLGDRFWAHTVGDACAFFSFEGAIYPLVKANVKLDNKDFEGNTLDNFFAYCDTDIANLHYSKLVPILTAAEVICLNNKLFEAVGQNRLAEVTYRTKDPQKAAEILVEEAVDKDPDAQYEIMILRFISKEDYDSDGFSMGAVDYAEVEYEGDDADYYDDGEINHNDEAYYRNRDESGDESQAEDGSLMNRSRQSGNFDHEENNPNYDNYSGHRRDPAGGRARPRRSASRRPPEDSRRPEGRDRSSSTSSFDRDSYDSYDQGQELFEPKVTGDSTLRYNKSSLQPASAIRQGVTGPVASMTEGSTRRFSTNSPLTPRSKREANTSEFDSAATGEFSLMNYAAEDRAEFTVKKSDRGAAGSSSEPGHDYSDEDLYEPRYHDGSTSGTRKSAHGASPDRADQDLPYDTYDYDENGEPYDDYDDPYYSEDNYLDYDHKYKDHADQAYHYGDEYDSDYNDSYSQDYPSDPYYDNYDGDYPEDYYENEEYHYDDNNALQAFNRSKSQGVSDPKLNKKRKIFIFTSAFICIVCIVLLAIMIGDIILDKKKKKPGSDKIVNSKSTESRERESEDPYGEDEIMDVSDNELTNDTLPPDRSRPTTDVASEEEDAEEPVPGETMIWKTTPGDTIISMAMDFYGSSDDKYIKVLREANKDAFANGDIPPNNIEIIAPQMKSAPYYGKTQNEIIALWSSQDNNSSGDNQGQEQPQEEQQEIPQG